jgi:hypothetical protein
VKTNNGLDTRLIVHIHDSFLTDFGGHHISFVLKSILTSKEILHANTMYTIYFFKNVK